MHRFSLIMDQQVGLKTQALNWERVVRETPDVDAAIVSVCYAGRGGALSRLPGLPSGMKGTLRGVREIQDGWKAAGAREAVLWATWAAKSVPELVRAAPAYFVMDMTPTQMEAMGALYGYSAGRARLGAKWKRRATAKIYAQARHFFPWNAWVGQSLHSDWGVPEDKITPISPGVDLTLFQPAPLKAERAGDSPVRLLFVGGDFQRKGGDLLLRWARETSVSVPWEMHLVTRDAVPPTLGVQVYHGISNNSPELVALYQSSDVFVLPTRADCYSLVAMEAMACGLPVVISGLGGIPEIVADGETGFLLEPDDYDALAAHLDTLVTDAARREAMGAAALARARTHFDCRANLGRILEMMKGK